MCMCVYVRVSMCMCVCVRVCMRVCSVGIHNHSYSTRGVARIAQHIVCAGCEAGCEVCMSVVCCHAYVYWQGRMAEAY